MAGAQVFDARLIQHIGSDLAAPADFGFVGFLRLLRGAALLHFGLIQFGAQHVHRLGAVAVLGSVVLALHDDAGRRMRDAHG